MKLASLKPLQLCYGFAADDASRYLRGKRLNFLLVRAMATDGTVGYGEVCDSFCCNYPTSMSAVIEEALAPLFVGKILDNVEDLVANARRMTRRRLGDHGMVVQALSGVEIALWDLGAKVAAKPVCELLGATVTDLPIYASGSFLDEGGAEWHVKYFEPLMTRGVRAVKVRLGVDYEPQLQTLRELRAALGNDVRLMVDGNEFFTLDQALEIAGTLADLNVFFFEEPIAQCERDAIASLVQRSPVPIAYGEHLFLVHDFADCLQHRRAGYLQPDASICGGMAEGVRIAQLARKHGVGIAPHSAAGPVSLAANLHMAAAMGGIDMIEYSFPLAPMWRDTGGAELLIDEIHDGRIRIPQGVGLGVEPGDELIASSSKPPMAAVSRSASQ